MSKVVQQVKITDEVSLFIVGFDMITDEVSFRTSQEPSYLQKEQGVFDKATGMIHLNLYHFHKSYLQNFIKENKLKNK